MPNKGGTFWLGRVRVQGAEGGCEAQGARTPGEERARKGRERTKVGQRAWNGRKRGRAKGKEGEGRRRNEVGATGGHTEWSNCIFSQLACHGVCQTRPMHSTIHVCSRSHVRTHLRRYVEMMTCMHGGTYARMPCCGWAQATGFCCVAVGI